MAITPNILAFAGSTRKESLNKQLVKVAAKGAQAAGANVMFLDLRDYPLPMYDGDLEAESGIPENAMKLKKLFIEHHGFLISSPEYNGSISAVLKNTIDWISRPAPGEAPLAAFTHKAAGLLSASPGALGGLRGLVHLRAILGNIGVLVLPTQMAVSKGFEAFNTDGSLKDPKQNAAVEGVGKTLADMLRKLNP